MAPGRYSCKTTGLDFENWEVPETGHSAPTTAAMVWRWEGLHPTRYSQAA